jgi:DNA-directed RNA polymerase specialized sigma24 family protein
MVNNHSTAEDLLQETYLRVTRALSERPSITLNPSCSRPRATWRWITCVRADPGANHGR